MNDAKVVLRISDPHLAYLRSGVAGPDNADGPDRSLSHAVRRLLSDGSRWRRLTQDERESFEARWEDGHTKGKVPKAEPLEPTRVIEMEVASVTGWATGEIL